MSGSPKPKFENLKNKIFINRVSNLKTNCLYLLLNE